MRPEASASGMNLSGSSCPRVGWFQRTSASSPAIAPLLEVEDRLVVELELGGLDRPLEIDLELDPLDDVGVHVRGVGAVAALALGLGPVHREVGVAKERLGVLGAGGDPDARAHVDLAPLDRDRIGERLEDAARGRRRVGRVVDLLDQDGELVAAEARDRVGRAQAGLEAGRDRLEELVAGPVAERVVDRLEVVDVDEEDADRVAASRGAADCEREAVEEEGAVGHAGERVVEGLVRDVVERPGVVEGEARVLGEGEKRLLVARGVGAVWVRRTPITTLPTTVAP